MADDTRPAEPAASVVLIRMTTPCHAAVLSVSWAALLADVQPFDGVRVVIDDLIDAHWIAYDQHDEEMSRG